MFCIYRVTNNINGKTYIGQHKYEDDANPMGYYKGSGKTLLKAYKKYGQENFTIEVLYKRIQYKETADSMEIWMIEKERKSNVNGCYNICKGGSGICGLAPWNKGKTGVYSDEVIERNRQTHLGKHHSEESRKKISEGTKGHIVWNKGKKCGPRSEETRLKISAAHQGMKASEETRKKLSKAHKGKKLGHWYNNGEINIRTFECPEGFIPGRLSRRTSS